MGKKRYTGSPVKGMVAPPQEDSLLLSVVTRIGDLFLFDLDSRSGRPLVHRASLWSGAELVTLEKVWGGSAVLVRGRLRSSERTLLLRPGGQGYAVEDKTEFFGLGRH